MRNMELINQIRQMSYRGTFQTNPADCKLVLEDIVALIDKERPEPKSKVHPQQDVGMDY